MKDPRTLVERIERDRRLPGGRAERFVGYAVMGMPFTSGHVLAMRRFPASSVGSAYTSIWHRDPEGGWTMWVDVDPQHACPRYFGRGLEQIVRAPVRVAWPDAHRMVVTIDQGGWLNWEVVLASTSATRFLNAASRATPGVLRRRRAILAAMAAVAGPMLRAGTITLHGTAPNGQWFKADPTSIWVIAGGRARLEGTDVGGVATLSEAVALGDLLIPRRGLFAVGQGLFEPFDARRHYTVASREADPSRSARRS